MDRCNYFTQWLDAQSSKLDEVENNYGRCLVTGKKKKTSKLSKLQAWSKVFQKKTTHVRR